jgi:hypothetical protein
MQAERAPIAARLDAIDSAIQNVSHIYGLSDDSQTASPQKTEKRKYRRAATRRVARKMTAAEKSVSAGAGGSGDAAVRRATLFDLINKSEVGLSVGELRKATPKMHGQDRLNALQQLKASGEIRRAGNAWVKA